MQRLPKTMNGLTNAPPPYTTPEWQIKLPEQEERVVCYILHTAEFCRDTIEGLAAAIQKDIKPSLADQVDMSEEENAYTDVASACMSVLDMSRVRWDSIEQPGDDSMFVNTLRRSLLDCAPRLGDLLDPTSFSFLCDKMARMFVPRFTEHVYRIRKISEKGTLQLARNTTQQEDRISEKVNASTVPSTAKRVGRMKKDPYRLSQALGACLVNAEEVAECGVDLESSMQVTAIRVEQDAVSRGRFVADAATGLLGLCQSSEVDPRILGVSIAEGDLYVRTITSGFNRN
eukprot:gene5789-2585_t